MAEPALTPEQALQWALVDHKAPWDEDAVVYSVDQQIKSILAVLREAGYKIVRESHE